MKKLSLYLLLSLTFLILSCSNDTIDDAIANQNATVEDINPVQTDTPCDFSIQDITENSTVTIDCIIDLQGATITLPSNVNFNFEGGDIFNGTLIFNGGYIDGNLLNQHLQVEGDVVLKEDTFTFYSTRWDIDQSALSRMNSDRAQQNTNNLESLFYFIKELGGTTFSIHKLNAYFEVGKVTSTTSNQNFYPSIEAINVPSDFNLIMSDDTFLRVYPNNNPRYALLAVRDVANVTITGGNLVGDRIQHTFTNGGTHEKGHLLHLHAAVNTIVSGVTMTWANGDGLKVDSLNFTFQDNYKPSHDIVIRACTFDSNRRNNLSITDGYNIVVEENTFLNAGATVEGSEGTAPMFAIDIEAHREREANGEITYYERAQDITVRNNTERGSVAGGFAIYIGENVIIEDNDVETSISWSYTQGSVIRNNRVTANPNRENNTGIIGGRSDNTATTFDNEIYGNTVTGFESGITVFSIGNKVYQNTINNCVNGIFLRVLKDSEIYGNKINSTVAGSKGIFAHVTSLENVTIYDNETNTEADPFKFVRINSEPEHASYLFTVRNNDFNASGRATIESSKGLTFENNFVGVSTEVKDSNGINIADNNIQSGDSVGIRVRNQNEDISITGNSITTTNIDCISVESSTNPVEVETANNNCQNGR